MALFACGLLFGDLLATTNFPALNATPSQLREYFLRNVSEVRALSFFHLLAAAALAVFASYLYARLRSAGIRVAALALAGGIIAAGFLAMSALCYRVLAEHSVANDPALAHALVVLSYLAGGPAIGVPLALTTGAFAAAIRRERTLPGWLYWLSIVATVLGSRERHHDARADKQQLACLRRAAASGGAAVRVARGEQLGAGRARTPPPVIAPPPLTD